MIKSTKNKIFEYIRNKSQFNIEDFEFYPQTIIHNVNAEPIRYLQSPMSFYIHIHPQDHLNFRFARTVFSPSYFVAPFFPGYVQMEALAFALINWFETDLNNYINELNTVDLWEEYLNGDRLLNIGRTNFDDKGNFSNDEIRQITLAIKDLKLLIHEKFDSSLEQQIVINDRLEYLIEALPRLNRFDWKSVLASTFFAICVALTLDTTRGNELYKLFQIVLRIIPHLPLISP